MHSGRHWAAALLGAGAIGVHAFPRPQSYGFGNPQYPTFSLPGPVGPTTLPYPVGPGTGSGSVYYPLPSSSGSVSSIGTGVAISYPTNGCSVRYVYPSGAVGTGVYSTGMSVPAGTSVSYLKSAVPKSSYVASSASMPAPQDSVSVPISVPPSQSSKYVPEESVSSAAAAAAPSAVASSVTASAGCTFTDADSAAASKGSCSTIVLSGITVPAGDTLDMTDLNDGTTVSFEGTTTFEYDEWEGPLISFSGKSITITGASGHVIDGNGAKWWDGEGSNGGVTKPKFFYAHDLTDSVISGLNVKNTPVQGFSVDGAQNLKIEDVTIDDTDGDTQGGHNTDCFDIGESTGVYLSGVTCKNQDDCIAINSGEDIQFTGGTCSGGHGLSIGSVGGRDDNTVENIYIASSSISDSENGVRIKCNSGDTGSVKNVTYESITLSGITDYGIVIEQDYENGSPTGTPTDGIPITDVTLKGITGSVSDDAQAYYILCAACSDWTVSGVDVTGGSQSDSCEGVPSGVDLC